MERFKIAITTVILICFLGNTHICAESPPPIQHSAKDNLQIQEQSPDAKIVIKEGGQILNLTGYKTFAVVWFPKGFQKLPKRRTLFVMHGSGGNAYQGIYHQLKMAKKYQYALVSLHWRHPNDTYFSPKEVLSMFSLLTPYLVSHYDIDTTRMALETFRRSSSNSYAIAYWDKALQTNLFKIFICQSGGVPKDNPLPLLKELIAGKFGANPYEGQKFFLYCGEKDDQWGSKMCESVRYAKSIIEQHGGIIVRFIDDPIGHHGGLHNTPEYFESAIQSFIAATP